MKKFDFQVKYKDKTYRFNSGQEALLFQKGIENGVQKRYGMKGLSEYVSKVYDCYVKHESVYPPIEHLGWFVAQNYSEFRTLDSEKILELFDEYLADEDDVEFHFGG